MTLRFIRNVVIIVVVAGVIILFTNTTAPVDNQNTGTNMTPIINAGRTVTTSPDDYPAYPIAELIADFETASLRSGTFMTQGYVMSQRTCPPCPDGAQCEECLPNALIVGETASQESFVALETDDPLQYEDGGYYTFTVSIDVHAYEPILLRAIPVEPGATDETEQAIDYPDYLFGSLVQDRAEGQMRTGTFDVEGYAVSTTLCPVCEEADLCPPCAGDTVNVAAGPEGIVIIPVVSDDASQYSDPDTPSIFSIQIDDPMGPISLISSRTP